MIVIKIPKNMEEFKAYYLLRYQVLREPWGQPKGTEKDDYEPISKHFMAIDDETNNVVGAVKYFEKEPGVGWFSHLAVAEKCQRQGIGKLLVKTVEDAVRDDGYEILGVMSRLTSTEYFKKFGYQIKGLPLHYFGTTQVVWMEKKIKTKIG